MQTNKKTPENASSNYSDYEKNLKYVKEHWKEIQEIYGGKYIGVINGGDLIIADEDIGKVLCELKNLGKEKDAYFGYIKGKDEVWIF